MMAFAASHMSDATPPPGCRAGPSLQELRLDRSNPVLGGTGEQEVGT